MEDGKMWETLFGSKAAYDALGNVTSPATTGLFQNSANWLMDNSKGLSAATNLWGAYNQYNMGNKIYDLQKNAYDYNKYLSDLAIKRQNQQDSNLATGYANSAYTKA